MNFLKLNTLLITTTFAAGAAFAQTAAPPQSSSAQKEGFANGEPAFEGNPVDFPEAWPVAVVPKGGYLQKDVPAPVWKMINGFDESFTQLLHQLQVVWEHGDQSALVHAVEMMFGLTDLARSLMSTEIGKGRGNYGPCFRVL